MRCCFITKLGKGKQLITFHFLLSSNKNIDIKSNLVQDTFRSNNLKSYDKLINVQTLYILHCNNYKALYIAILHWIYKNHTNITE